jgi:hypothetical protein
MNTAHLVQEADRVGEILLLTQSVEALVPKTKNGHLSLALLSCMEKRLESLHRRLLEAALVELLWEYMDHVEGTDLGYVARQLIMDIGTGS